MKMMKWSNKNGVIVDNLNSPVVILAPGLDEESIKIVENAPKAKELMEFFISEADRGVFHKKKLYNLFSEHLKKY